MSENELSENEFDKFCVILANLSPGNAPKWNPGVMKIYQVGLRAIPDAAAGPLTEAIIDACIFRPAVAEILHLYRQITQREKPSAFQLVSHITQLVTQYGRYGQPSREYRNFYTEGPPAELCAEAHLALSIFGGWVKYCDNLDPEGVTRAHLLKAAQAVVDGMGSETMLRLQVEYKANQAMLPAPAILLSSDNGMGEMRGLPAKGGSGGMTALGALPLKQLTGGAK